MPAAAVPIGASLLAPEVAGALGTTALGASLASTAPWLLPALSGAALSGIGSAVTGGNPLKGALMGGIGGGIGSMINGGSGLSGLFGGGTSPSLEATQGALGGLSNAGEFANAPGINLSLGNAGTAAGSDVASQFAAGAAAPSSSGLFGDGMLGKLAIPVGLAGGAALLDSSMAPKTLGPPMQKHPTNPGNVAPLARQQEAVNPNDYFTSGGNRNFFQDYSMQPRFMAKGGRACYANGGSSSASSMNIPMGIGRRVKGPGTGQSDSIPAMLSDGEFVVSAPVVSALGNGSNDAGAKKLSKMQKGVLQKHYKGKPKKSQALGNYMH